MHDQFKLAVAEGRKLSIDVVEKYADGRIFTGETAVKAGFADQLGSFEDAVRVAAEMAGLGQDPKLYEPFDRKQFLHEVFGEVKLTSSPLSQLTERLSHLKLSGQPLYIMPGAYGF